MASMDAAGVDKAVLVQYASVHGYDCRYVLDTVARWPRRFVAVCAVDTRGDAGVEQMAEAVRHGAAGLRIATPGGREDSPDWILNANLWRRASELGVPLCVHLLVNANALGVPMLRNMMERFPDVQVVLDHLANPPWGEGAPDYGLRPILEMARLNLILKFATVNLERTHEAGVDASVPLRILADAFGAERLMWGSDAPNTPGDYNDMLHRMRAVASVLSGPERDLFFGGTATRVYPGLAAAEPASTSGGAKS
jgi:predicted TIM-barrel fold metal-dependent hydrolase